MEHTRETRMSLALLAVVSLLSVAAPARAAPDPVGALAAAVDMPLRATGSAIGGVGLVAASVLGLGGDAVRAIDGNPLTRPVLGGVFSNVVYRGALLVSGVSTSALEALRGEDIERLPEAQAAYLEAAPLVGRFDTALTGGAALTLAVGDLVSWPALVVLRLVGAEGTADRLAQARDDARVSFLGPSPLPARPDAGDAQPPE